MSEKIWTSGDEDKIEISVDSDTVHITVRDMYEGQVAGIYLRGVEPISEIIEHLKTFISKPFDPIKRSEIPTVDDMLLKLQEQDQRQEEQTDKLVKHYTLKITDAMRKQVPNKDLKYMLESDPVPKDVLTRLSNDLRIKGWVLQTTNNHLYPASSPYEMILTWTPRPMK